MKEAIEKMVLMCHHSTLNARLLISKVGFMLNINMQLGGDNVSSAGPLQSTLLVFVSSFLGYAARVYQTTLMLTQSSSQNEWL